MGCRKVRCALILAGCALLLSAPCWAATEDARPGDVVVTASRTEQEIKDTPAAAEVITREDIEKLGAQNLGEALRLSIGIDLNAPAMSGRSVSLRGMDTRHVLILVDGKRLVSEGSHSTANTYELKRIDMNNVERVEIIRGPVSSLYGSEAMAGVINIITRKPEKREITLSFSPWRYSRSGGVGGEDLFFRYDNGKKDRFAWLVSYNRSQSSAFENQDKGSGWHNSVNNQYGYIDAFNFEATYDLANDMYLDFSANLARERLKGRSSPKQFARFENDRTQFSLGLRGSTERSSYEARAYYGKHEKDAPVYNYEGGRLINFDVSEREAWVIEGHVSTQYGENHLVTVGGEYRTESYWGTRVGSGTVDIVENGGIVKTAGERDMDSHAIYIQDEWLVNDRLLIVPSIRYDNNNRFSENFSPKLGITYKFNDNYRIKANVGKSFKAPTLDDMYMSMTRRMGPFIVTAIGNPNLKPEKSTSYELSLEGEKGKNFGKLTYFMNDVSDLLTSKSTRVGMAVTSTNYNEDEADIDGVELELGRYLSDFFTFKLNYTWLDATGTDGSRLPKRSEHRGAVQLHYDDRRENGLSAVLWLDWNKNYLSSLTNEELDFCTLNFSLTKKINDTVSWFVGVDNIFNKKEVDIDLYGTILRAGATITL